MNIAPIGESVRIAPSYANGVIRIQLREDVRHRYRQYGSERDGYEFVIDANSALKIKRARKNGKLMSLLERLWYGSRARFAIVTNQPIISSLLPALIPLDDQRLSEPEVWQLLAYDIEWQIESTERFYLHFLTTRPQVTEYDAIVAIAGAIRAQIIHIQSEDPAWSASSHEADSLAQAVLDEAFIRHVNQRIVNTGITIRHFYPPKPNQARKSVDPSAIVDALLHSHQVYHLPPWQTSRDASLYAALINGLLCHLTQELSPAKQWLEQVWHLCGFDIAYDEICAALTGDPNQLPLPVFSATDSIRRHPTAESGDLLARAVPNRIIAPVDVVQKLKEAGHAQLRLANRTPQQATERRMRLREKALTLCEFALFLSTSPILTNQESTAFQDIRVELLALVQSLCAPEQTRKVQIALHPDSTVHLMTVTFETATLHNDATPDTVQPVYDILPLAAGPDWSQRDLVSVWTPAAAAKEIDFVGAAQEIDVTLQVLEPNPAPDPDGEASAAVLFLDVEGAYEPRTVCVAPVSNECPIRV